MIDNENNPFEIEQDLLDKEWVRQPQIYFEYATKAASALENRDRLKSNLDYIIASTSKDVREAPEKYGLAKVTESAVAETVAVNEMVTAATDAYNAARTEHYLLEKALVALDHKKKALENLVYLHGQNYFSSPQFQEKAASQQVKEFKNSAAKKSVAKILKRRPLLSDDSDSEE